MRANKLKFYEIHFLKCILDLLSIRRHVREIPRDSAKDGWDD